MPGAKLAVGRQAPVRRPCLSLAGRTPRLCLLPSASPRREAQRPWSDAARALLDGLLSPPLVELVPPPNENESTDDGGPQCEGEHRLHAFPVRGCVCRAGSSEQKERTAGAWGYLVGRYPRRLLPERRDRRDGVLRLGRGPGEGAVRPARRGPCGWPRSSGQSGGAGASRDRL